ncbi:uncharacterized protein LOC127870730 [Dreissena polymorpha]|uniref:B box-type domain-containing protein n=1 Tax=Dreissena polymorpha TaxID=45954 RepID=A0A9D4L131_DREPO|nr:uncharacterized protein LOC127870730 [Dreissena polymorpha]KAH3849788.1 hypothetical protein DPMN_092192 [Dreissena polymorpha]
MECSLNECGVCAAESVVAFCENCNFRICGSCFQMHKKSTKLFQNHVAFAIEETKQNLDICISENDVLQFLKQNSGDIHTHKCARHTTENLVLFCPDHIDTLCARCVVSFHKSCKLIDLFEVHVDEEEVSTCKSNLHDIEEELKSAENKIEKNTLKNKACKNEFLEELQQLRREVNKWFDHQQLKCGKQCSKTFETNGERLTKVQTFCKENRQRIQEHQELIDTLKAQNHVKRLYVVLNQIRKEIEQIKLKFNWLHNESGFNGYVFQRSNGLEQLLNVQTFDIGGLEEWCNGSDDISDDSLSSVMVFQLKSQLVRTYLPISQLGRNYLPISQLGQNYLLTS